MPSSVTLYLVLKAGSLTKLVVLARLTGQRPHGICLSVPRPPVLRLQACVVMKDFYVMLGIWTHVLFFTQKMVLAPEPSPQLS